MTNTYHHGSVFFCSAASWVPSENKDVSMESNDNVGIIQNTILKNNYGLSNFGVNVVTGS